MSQFKFFVACFYYIIYQIDGDSKCECDILLYTLTIIINNNCVNIQKIQLDQVLLHEWKRGDYVHMRRVVDKFILLGEKTRALDLLLATNVNDPNYYTDALK